ncbi:MAG: hypothetical protein LQ349_000999 [Xanthoria aureola]|nr:MAG: hypothetical protein LQ349_000999 [Xanthoria aureola]
MPGIASGLYKQVASDCVQKLPTDLEQRLVSAERGFPHNGFRRSFCVRNVRVVTHLLGMTEADATPRSQWIRYRLDENMGLEQQGREISSAVISAPRQKLTGGQRQWKDIRHKYVQTEEDEDE